MADVITLPVGYIGTNCYLISNDKNQVVIVDPGGDPETLIEKINQDGLNPLAILLTHAHFDHIGAIDDLCEAYNIPFYIHKDEIPKLTSSKENLSASYGIDFKVATKPIILSDSLLNLGDFKIKWFETPGHTIGGVCYLIEGNLTSGDTLFKGSVGRTDFPNGSMADQLSSIKMLIDTLPGDTVVYPGHGPSTTLIEESQTNPFLV